MLPKLWKDWEGLQHRNGENLNRIQALPVPFGLPCIPCSLSLSYRLLFPFSWGPTVNEQFLPCCYKNDWPFLYSVLPFQTLLWGLYLHSQVIHQFIFSNKESSVPKRIQIPTYKKQSWGKWSRKKFRNLPRAKRVVSGRVKIHSLELHCPIQKPLVSCYYLNLNSKLKLNKIKISVPLTNLISSAEELI